MDDVTVAEVDVVNIRLPFASKPTDWLRWKKTQTAKMAKLSLVAKTTFECCIWNRLTFTICLGAG